MNRKRLKEIALLLSATALSLALMEGIIRTFHLAPGVVTHTWNGGTRVVVGPEFKYTSQINSLRLRDHREFSTTSPARRVCFLGDSFTFGLGVSNHETFSTITEDTLNDCTDRSWTILNAGRSGSGTVRQLDKLRDLLEVIEFDEVVLFYFIGNDPYESLREERQRSSDNRVSTKRNRFQVDSLKNWLFENVAIYRLLKLRLGGTGFLRKVDYTLADQSDPELYDSFQEHDAATRKALSEMKSVLATRNIDFSVILIPRQEQLTADAFDAFKHTYSIEVSLDRFLPQNRVVDQILSPLEILYLDLLPILEGKSPTEYFFPVDGHFNRDGHRFLSTLLVDLLLEKLDPSEPLLTHQCRR